MKEDMKKGKAASKLPEPMAMLGRTTRSTTAALRVSPVPALPITAPKRSPVKKAVKEAEPEGEEEVTESEQEQEEEEEEEEGVGEEEEEVEEVLNHGKRTACHVHTRKRKSVTRRSDSVKKRRGVRKECKSEDSSDSSDGEDRGKRTDSKKVAGMQELAAVLYKLAGHTGWPTPSPYGAGPTPSPYGAAPPPYAGVQGAWPSPWPPMQPRLFLG